MIEIRSREVSGTAESSPRGIVVSERSAARHEPAFRAFVWGARRLRQKTWPAGWSAGRRSNLEREAG